MKDYIQAKRTEEFVEEMSGEMDENDFSDVNINDIIDRIEEMNPNLDKGSFGVYGTGATAPNNKPTISDDFWRGLPRFE